jgi:quinol monooxygenase YgiN
MPDIPWTVAGDMEPGRAYVVMASHLPLRTVTTTLRFFRAVGAVRKQLRSAEGLVGYTLRAKPLARDYWTLSVWTDRAALQAFMRTPPHLGVMSSLKPFMGRTKFVQWEITAVDGRPNWNEALERLASSTSGRDHTAADPSESDRR